MSTDKQNFSLPASQRLKKPAQFQAVYQSKQWGGTRYFSFNVLAKETKRQNQDSSLGVTVSKKVSKNAVDRNRIKRQIKEFYRHRKTQLENVDIIITAKPSCLQATDEQRIESLNELWNKILKWQHWHQRQTKNKE